MYTHDRPRDVEHLPSMWEALGSIYSTKKKVITKYTPMIQVQRPSFASGPWILLLHLPGMLFPQYGWCFIFKSKLRYQVLRKACPHHSI